METMADDNHNTFYNNTNPWSPPPNAYDFVPPPPPAKHIEAPLGRSFTGTLEIGFSIGMANGINVSALLNRFLSFTLKTDTEFHILPLEEGNQSIAWPNGIPPSKKGIDLYFQHNTVKDGVRGKINVTMSKSIGKIKEIHSAFRAYLNNEKVYASQVA
jgi:hypothetical protein